MNTERSLETTERWQEYGFHGYSRGQWRVVWLQRGVWQSYATRPGYHEAGSINTNEHPTAEAAMRYVDRMIDDA